MRLKNKSLMKYITHTFMVIYGILCVIPFVLMVAASFTDEGALLREGYKLWPPLWSGNAYRYLSYQSDTIFRAYGITVLTTLVGTAVSLVITSMYAYVISRKDFKYRNVFAFLVFFTILFNGGLVPTYIMYTKYFVIKNSLWAYIIPRLLMNGFFVMIMRTFFAHTIPEAVIESARIDGAGEFKIYVKMIVPMSVSIFATIGVFVCVNYWNEWYNGLIYVTQHDLYSLQNLLNRIISDIKFILSSDVRADDAITRIPTTSVRMAIAVIGVFPILIAYPFFQKFFVKGITIGAVKG